MLKNYLPQLYYFYLVAKYQSFTQAAQELQIAQSAVSVQIKKLENILEITLFHRQARNSLDLTKPGCTLFKYCKEIFEKVDAAYADLKNKEDAGDIVINSSVLFGTYILMPFLKGFRNKYPKINVLIQLNDEFVDLQRENIDLAIRWGQKNDSKLKYHPLIEQEQVPVAAKSYLKNCPKLIHPRQLSDHTVICWTTERPDWSDWLKQLPKKEWPEFKNCLPIQNVSAQRQAVKAGIGVALLPLYTVLDLVQSKQVKILFPKLRSRFHPAYMCHLKSDYIPKKTKIFIKALKTYVNSLPIYKR